MLRLAWWDEFDIRQRACKSGTALHVPATDASILATRSAPSAARFAAPIAAASITTTAIAAATVSTTFAAATATADALPGELDADLHAAWLDLHA